MRQMPAWERVLIISGLIVAILLPVVLFTLNNPKISKTLPVVVEYSAHQLVSPNYSAKSEVPGYALTLKDTRYLDYITAKFRTFEAQGVIDPQKYHVSRDITIRRTVSKVQLILVPSVPKPLALIDGKTGFISMSDYDVVGDTLVVRVSLTYDNLLKNPTGPDAFEDAFTQAALPAFYYAQGLQGANMNSSTFAKIRQEIKDYLNNGIFGWPIRITSV